MNVALRPDRARLERFGRLVKEGKRREARTAQSQYGWYDEEGIRQGGLIAFVRYFWHLLEPETPFVDGWPLWAMCLPYRTKITTSEGEKYIGDIVESGWAGSVLSFNHMTAALEWKPIVARMKSPGQSILRLETSRSSVLRLTHNHPVYAAGRGYVRADEIKAGDRVYLHSLPQGLHGSAKRQPVLQPQVLPRPSVTCGPRSAYAQLQALWEAILSPAVAPNRRFLFDGMLGSVEDGPREHDLSAVWRKENLESRSALSCVLDALPRKRTASAVRLVWSRVLPQAMAGEAAAIAEVWKGIRQFLQSAMRGKGKPRQEQSFLCQWQAREQIPSRILDDTAQNSRARAKSLLSLLRRAKETGRSSYRSGYDEQRDMESRGAVPQVPLPATRSFDEGAQSAKGGKISTAVVTAVVREAWVPDAVYNIEVLENQNYFAESILVHNCEHLEAVTAGRINRLLMNVPPGFMKSLLVDVFWPAWEWGPMNMAHLRYVTFSYSASLTERDNGRFGDLVSDIEFQILYGDRVRLIARGKPGVTKVHNTKKGWKLASSVGGVGTGERGNRVILDDPHNVKEAESEVVRAETVRWFREAMSNRLNDLDRDAIVVIMQRVHEDDVSGVIQTVGLDYTILCIPMEYDWTREPTTIGWVDPRGDDEVPDEEREGEGAWDARFPEHVRERTKREIGPYAWAGQYQQSPAPRGGGIFQRSWWQLWAPDDGRFPPFEYLVASLDSAYTEKEENDPSALTIWGVFRNAEGQRRIMLVHAWRKHLQFSADRSKLLPLPEGNRYLWEGNRWRENPSWIRWKRRTEPHWGLIEWVQDTCSRFRVDRLLIEAKASGMSAAQELRNRFGLQNWAIECVPVHGDKYSRALAVQPTFSQMMIYAPERDWSQMVIDEMAVFPKGKFKDLTDSSSQAIKHLRDRGLAETDEEVHAAEIETVMHKPRRKLPYRV